MIKLKKNKNKCVQKLAITCLKKKKKKKNDFIILAIKSNVIKDTVKKWQL